MSNFQTLALITEGNTSTAPSHFVASTTDSLATMLVAGYLTDLAAKIKPNDIIWVNYSDLSTFPLDTGMSATLGQFVVSYGSSAWSMTQSNVGSSTARVAITAVAFNGMYAAPILLVAAPGVGKMLVLEKASLVMTYNSAAYAAGGVAAVQWAPTINGAGIIASTTIAAAAFQVTASTVFTFNGGVVAAPFTTTANQGLYLSNVTAAFTTGDSPMVANVVYRIVSTV